MGSLSEGPGYCVGKLKHRANSTPSFLLLDTVAWRGLGSQMCCSSPGLQITQNHCTVNWKSAVKATLAPWRTPPTSLPTLLSVALPQHLSLCLSCPCVHLLGSVMPHWLAEHNFTVW